MKTIFMRIIPLVLLMLSLSANGQPDSLARINDSINRAALQEYNQKLQEIKAHIIADSIKKAEL